MTHIRVILKHLCLSGMPDQGLSIQRVKNLYNMFKNCCRPVCPSIIDGSWFTSGQ